MRRIKQGEKRTGKRICSTYTQTERDELAAYLLGYNDDDRVALAIIQREAMLAHIRRKNQKKTS